MSGHMSRRFLQFTILAVACNASAQTITVRLIHGKTGKPIADKNVTVYFSSNAFSGTVIRIDRNGLGHVVVPKGAENFSLMEGPKDGKEPSRVAYIDCNQGGAKDISIHTVLETGFAPVNDCSAKSTTTKPGEVVFWGLPRPWYVPDMQ